MDTQALVQRYRISPQDVGSSQVQIIEVTAEIQRLTRHLTQFPKDVHSRRGLIRMVNRRKSLLSYLSKRQHDLYKKLVADLGLRG